MKTKIETDARIIIDLGFVISENTANQMIELIRETLKNNGFDYEDIELDY